MREGSEPTDGRTLRTAGAGVVLGLGSYFLVQRLSLASTDVGDPYDVPFLLLAAAVLYAGYWLLGSDASTRSVGRVALYSLAGFLTLIAVAVWLGGGRAVDLQGSVSLALDVGTVGASSGLLVGLEGIRREAAGGDRADARRAEERFAFFNRLLRHHLLNGVAVVRGYAELLAETEAAPSEEVEIIRRRSDEIVDLVRNIETLGRAMTGELARLPVDPRPPLLDAVDSVRADRPTTRIDTAISTPDRVIAHECLDVVFEATLAAAIEAADEGITVTTVADREYVATFAFDGALGTEVEPRTRPGEHGESALGLFLAETLVEYVDGALERTPEDDLRIRLPLA